MSKKRPAIIVSALVALALAAGVIFAFGQASASQSTQLQAARDNLANCQLLAARSTGAQRTRALQCVTDQQLIITLLTSGQPTPPPTTAPPTPVTHGRDISDANTGFLAWRGPDGQRCTDATLKVYAGRVLASQLGASASCVWLKQGLTVDAAITLTAARIDTVVRSDGPKLTINYSVIDGHGNGTYSVGGHNVDVFRSQIIGSSDGVRLEGMNLVEDYIRVVSTSPDDHNDGIQAYLADSGGSILRCNIDTRPVGGPAGVFGNAAIFLADGSNGEVEIRDNYLAGGGYTLRLHESQRYRVTGNVIADWAFGPVSTTNAVNGAFLEWANNVTAAGDPVNP